MDFTFTFLHLFFLVTCLISPLLLAFTVCICVLGMIVGKIECWSRGDALYWAFITALTVGYGDYRPQRRLSRILSILIAVLGLLMTGILVAVSVQSASIAFKKHIDQEGMQAIEQRINLPEADR
ncbi:potassium channel family protein [Coraliomargarita parva]|uniref:potassium channel family protein n=1 Tax=Coraliomargarita parva TaxID=3014050 RepID=UPI0022B4F4B9|nr:potassium channel family protein [Coraliomargarita parva]